MNCVAASSHAGACVLLAALPQLEIPFSGFVGCADRPGVCGAIAQLGERLPCTQEVSGSIPLGSTTSSLVTVSVKCSWLRIFTGNFVLHAL